MYSGKVIFMGLIYEKWTGRDNIRPESTDQARELVKKLRLFKDIEKADYGTALLDEPARSLIEDIKNNKKIVVWGDYDVDGVTSVISLLLFFQALDYRNISYKIPDRFTEGYGLNETSLNLIIDEKRPDTIITVDAGITSKNEALICKNRGVKLIVTDHHKIDAARLPDCIILNPKFHENPDYQELCGCATLFILLRHISRCSEFIKLKTEKNVDLWVTLTALAGVATICDIVPLNSVNHFLARRGMKCLACSRHPVLKTLMKKCAPKEVIQGLVDEVSVAFRVGPVINSVGRLSKAENMVKWFFQKDSEVNVAKMLNFNKERKEIQAHMETLALPLARAESDNSLIMIGHPDFHEGVVGILASRLVDKFYKPVLIYSESNGICKGSGRSIKGFSLYNALFECQKKGLFEKFGGHDMACGFSFKRENENLVKKEILEYALNVYKNNPDIWISDISFDFELPFNLVNLDTADAVESLKPFGNGFEQPVFMVRAQIKRSGYYVSKKEGPLKGKPAHSWFEIGPVPELALDTESKGGSFARNHRIVFFNRVFEQFQGIYEFLFKIESDAYGGKRKVKLMGLDMRKVF
jgi:single-stranded-DNA-specific exonuclease